MKGQKKGKKTFSDGLEEILHHTLFEDNLHDKPSMFELVPTPAVLTTQSTAPPIIDTKAVKNTKKNKSFADNLEDFFKNSIDEGFDSQIVSIKRNIIRNDERPAIGIDVLLQKTLVEEEQTPANQQRITFVLDTPKIELLKNIARVEQKPLNSVLLELIEMYLSTRPQPQEKNTNLSKTSNKTRKTKKV